LKIFGGALFYSLSHTLDTYSFLGVVLEGVIYLDFWSKEKEEQESIRGNQDE